MTDVKASLLLTYLGYTDDTAVSDFQRDFGIAADGIMGDETKKALRHAVAYGMPADEIDTDGLWDGIDHFEPWEFECRCGRCGGFPVQPKRNLLELCEKVRHHFGDKPMHIESGVRCPEHNAELPGSSPTSRHMDGMAVDFWFLDQKITDEIVLDYVASLPEVKFCYIMPNGGVHMNL